MQKFVFNPQYTICNSFYVNTNAKFIRHCDSNHSIRMRHTYINIVVANQTRRTIGIVINPRIIAKHFLDQNPCCEPLAAATVVLKRLIDCNFGIRQETNRHCVQFVCRFVCPPKSNFNALNINSLYQHYFQTNVSNNLSISARTNSTDGARESLLGLQLKYNEPRRKCLVLSVM